VSQRGFQRVRAAHEPVLYFDYLTSPEAVLLRQVFLKLAPLLLCQRIALCLERLITLPNLLRLNQLLRHVAAGKGPTFSIDKKEAGGTRVENRLKELYHGLEMARTRSAEPATEVQAG
jgi:hypothetical protein